MKQILKLTSVALLSASAVSLASAQTALVDFGTSNAAGSIGGNYFNVWNPGNNIDLLDTGGVTDTTWNLDSTTGAATNDGASPDFVFTTPSAPNPFNDDNIISDALNLTNTQGTRNVRVNGLDINGSYDIVIFGTREATGTRITDYSVIGLTTVGGSLTTSGTAIGTGAVNYNNDTVFSALGITPDANGRITIEYSTASSFGYLSAMSVTSVPEPGAYALIAGFASLAWIATRRRRA
jgi:hypothetical protein